MDKVVHFEVPFDDGARVKKFYGDVFGWQFQEFPEMDYTIARTVEVDDKMMPKESGAINGGMYKRDGELSKHATIVIKVSSIDESLGQVEAGGGKVAREKKSVGDMGFYAQIEDTEGNIVGLWEDVKK